MGSVDRLDILSRVTPDSYQERLLPGTVQDRVRKQKVCRSQ
jgi:hypothetical protein